MSSIQYSGTLAFSVNTLASHTCNGGRQTALQKCLISISGSFVYSPYIQLQFLESLLLKDVCTPLSGLIYLAFRRANPDDATMKDAKKALSDNGIDFNQLKSWNAGRCLELSVWWWKRDGYKIGLLVEGTNCTVFDLLDVYEHDGVLFISKINWDKNNYSD